MGSPYRIKSTPHTNIQECVTIEGKFTLTTGGAIGSVTRPSGGYNNVTAGTGLLYTVTQLATFASKTAANAYKVVFAENYVKHVCTRVNYNPAYSLTAAPANLYVAQCGQVDSTTNAFIVYLWTVGATGGANPASTVLPDITESLATGEIDFQATFINTVSPPSL